MFFRNVGKLTRDAASHPRRTESSTHCRENSRSSCYKLSRKHPVLWSYSIIQATAITINTVTNIFRGSVALICCFTVQRSVKTAVGSH